MNSVDPALTTINARQSIEAGTELALAGIFAMAWAAVLYAASPEPLKVGDSLPRVQGSFLTGRSATLPAAAAGKTALLLLGFTYDSRHAVEPWGEWFRNAMGGRANVTFFEMPMIGGFAKIGRWFIDRGMRKGTPEALHENVITVYTETSDWKRRLGVTEANENGAFLILLDQHGIVQWLHHGPFDAGVAKVIEEMLTSSIAQADS